MTGRPGRGGRYQDRSDSPSSVDSFVSRTPSCSSPKSSGRVRSGMIEKLPLKEIEAADQSRITGHGKSEKGQHASEPNGGGQAAGRGSGSRLRSFTLADLSWPQAARMSRPRGVRTGAE